MLTLAPRPLILAAVAGWLLAAGVGQAAAVTEVRDQANLFKPEAVKQANRVIKEIHDRFKEDLAIETFESVPADRKEQFEKAKDKDARNRFFDEWARQRASDLRVNGIYILITKQPGHLEVEVGNQTRKKVFTLEDRNHLRDLILAEFKEKRFDEGLTKGVNYVRDTMDRNRRAAADQPAPAAATKTAAPAKSEGINWAGWICIGLVVILGIWLVIALVRAFSGGGGMGGGGGWGGGGGFFPSLLGGLFGAAAGMWLYDSFFRGGSQAFGSSPTAGDPGAAPPEDTDYSGTGGDFGDDAGGGGGDFGGGDFGGGGGGDFGGGDFGGGDFGGGGDF